MPFLSAAFTLSLPAALLVFYGTPAPRRPTALLILSALFYIAWGVEPFLLLCAVTAAAYGAARLIERVEPERRKLRLTYLSVAALVLVLAFFKCARLSPRLDGALTALVPLGLSYYAFRIIGYLLDVYWEKIPAQRDFVSFALYVAFFPQIVSGPIQRAGDFFSQLPALGKPDATQFVAGLRRILMGLCRKILVADQLAVVVAALHAHPSAFSPVELLLGAYCYSFQLYMDFSGFTDLAIGIGLLFGIRGPENFNQPFLAPNIREFWRRWHMSLTSWLTDYLFFPLRMSLRRLGTAGLILAIFINMIAIGLWHGVAWTYLEFGILNGVFVIVSALTLKPRDGFFGARPRLAAVRKFAGPLLTFHLVVLTHIFFRAESSASAMAYLRGLFSAAHGLRFDPRPLSFGKWTLLGIVCGLATDAVRRPRWRETFLASPRALRWSAYYAAAVLVFLSIQVTMTFIYAQF